MIAVAHWTDVPFSTPYRWTMLGAIALSTVFWFIRGRREPLLLLVYLGALGGAFLGAKLAYLFAEGWRDWPLPDRWERLLTGKSVIGGLLGGYGGVELMKWLVGLRQATGDSFALIAPLALALGRVGCWLQGCCLGRPTSLHLIAARDATGVPRWPASQIELVFQLVMFALNVVLVRIAAFQGRVFFLYLAAYGAFRFLHEWLRDTPELVAGLTGYQILSLVAVVVGTFMFIKRGRSALNSCA